MAGAERLFSKQKIINNNLKKSCEQEHLSGIAISSIEKERTYEYTSSPTQNQGTTFLEIKKRKQIIGL